MTNEAFYQQALNHALERARQAESANLAKSEFLATLSHQLRIPLTGIFGMVQLLSLDCLLPSQQKQVEDILKASEHLLALIDDLLDVAQIEAGELKLQQVPFDVRKLIEETAEMLEFQTQAKGIQLLVSSEPKSSYAVVGDARIIRQIVLNLLTNALKFTEHGTIELRLKLIEKGAETKLIISVIDTGIGMPQDKIAALLAGLHQKDTAYIRRYGSTGLGLSITMSYLKSMHGELDIQSEVGKGSTFTCMIPITLQSVTASIKQEKKLAVERVVPFKTEQPIKILLVEDDELIQRVHKTLLEKLGCTVNVASNAEQALSLYENGYDLIFMDIGLPEVSGLEVTQKIRQLEAAQNKHVPIIGLTGYAHLEDKYNCLKVGMDDVVIKPAKLAELKNIIKSWTLNRGNT